MLSYVSRHPKGAWRYQKAIPKDLQELFRTRKGNRSSHFVEYIVAPSRREAEKKAAVHALRDDRLISILRAASPEERAEIIAAGGLKELTRAWPDMLHAAARYMSFIDNMHDPETQKAFAEHFKLAPGEAAQTLLGLKANLVEHAPKLAAIHTVLEKTADRLSETTLDGLFVLWKRVETPKGTRKHAAAIRLLESFLGVNVDVRTITQDHMAAFRDHLETVTTQQQCGAHLMRLRAMFGVAVNERKLSTNPCAGIKPRPQVRKKHVIDGGKEFYTAEQVRAILQKAEATKFGGKYHNDVLWALRLAFSTGARINEICQLRKDDVTVMDGVPVLIFHEGAEGQSVKNKSSARRMPLHPSVHGFLDYAANAKGPWVFSFKCYPNETRRAGWLQQRFPKFRREVCGITTNVTLHRARDYFIDAMRDAGVPEDRRKAIVGHAGDGIHAKYGHGAGLKVLAGEVARVDPLAG